MRRLHLAVAGVFTEQGELDAEISGQLDRIAAELLPTPERAGTNDATPGELP